MAVLQQHRQQQQLKLEREIIELREKNAVDKKKEAVAKLKELFEDLRVIANSSGVLSEEIIRASIVPVENLQPGAHEKLLERRQEKEKDDDESHGTDNDEQVEEDTENLSSVDKKLESGKYKDDVYALYHDIKLATIANLIKYPIGSEKYTQINDFFKFLSDCMFREAVRLGLLEEYKGEHEAESKEQAESEETTMNRGVTTRRSAAGLGTEKPAATDGTNGTNVKLEANGRLKTNKKKLTQEEYYAEERDRFESDIFNGFKKIFSDVMEFYGEAYYIMGQQGPMFSSLTGKAAIDPRETVTRGLFNTVQVLPPTKVQTGPYHLMYVSPPVATRIPHPSLPPSEILQFYVHPTNAPLPSTRWLKYDSYSSFAPSSDDFATVLKRGSSAAVWLDKVGLPIAEEAAAKREQDEYDNESNPEDDEDEDEEDEDDQAQQAEEDSDVEMKDTGSDLAGDSVNKSVVQTTEAAVKTESAISPSTSDIVNREASPGSSPALTVDDGINLLHVLEWSPASFVDDDEIEAAANGTQVELVSWLLLELQDMQRTRLAREDTSAFMIPERERRLALKIQNILSRLIGETNPKDLDLSLSHLLPILQTNYAGTLPGPPEPKTSQAGRSTTRTPSRQTRTKR
ncbi:Rsc58p [Sugiyamaella lignohabitans]|uniref:Rsc58p n=1 Tax=Sugiyamaella lignohabitans TaxID=796027 RepID=A0A167EKD0_9ASCO|nr:Rsc58p [Sugiyamaella lignohabitans]ANB14179.1 Rsc58p [Sugiyamaella lignohabitans]